VAIYVVQAMSEGSPYSIADERQEPVVGDEDGEQSVLLDRIDALRVVRADTPEERGRLLEEIGGSGKVEQDIVLELSKVRPLWKPRQFEEVHRLAMRSLEVLDRNGARQAPMPRQIDPLKPIASWLVQQVTRWIVKGHQNTLVTAIRRLYERREANAPWESDEHHMLRRARLDTARVEAGLKTNPIGLPTFLLGGAFLSGIFSGLQGLGRAAIGNRVLVVIVALAIVAVLASLAWVALYAAGVARRRIRLSTDQPIRALWDAVGAAGNPPRDESYNFAVYAIVLLIVAAIVVPAAIGLLVSLG
jgi:hypothetical protein